MNLGHSATGSYVAEPLCARTRTSTLRTLASPRLRKITAAALFVVTLVLLRTQAGGQGTVADPLQYAGGFLVTGDYAVGSVDLTNSTNPSSGGFSTGTINIIGVPANADVLAAYLFWETIDRTVVTNPEAGVQFNGSNVVDAEVGLVKRTFEDLGSSAPCFSSGREPLTLWAFKADVLRLLPMQMDATGPTGKRLANGAHTVRLPDASGGNVVPESAGAALLVVYRDPEADVTLNPLRRVVVYDGLKRKPDLVTTLTQTLRGFYGSSTAALATGVAKSTDHAYRRHWTTERERTNPVRRFARHADRDQSFRRWVIFAASVRKPDIRRELVDDSWQQFR